MVNVPRRRPQKEAKHQRTMDCIAEKKFLVCCSLAVLIINVNSSFPKKELWGLLLVQSRSLCDIIHCSIDAFADFERHIVAYFNPSSKWLHSSSASINSEWTHWLRHAGQFTSEHKVFVCFDQICDIEWWRCRSRCCPCDIYGYGSCLDRWCWYRSCCCADGIDPLKLLVAWYWEEIGMRICTF